MAGTSSVFIADPTTPASRSHLVPCGVTNDYLQFSCAALEHILLFNLNWATDTSSPSFGFWEKKNRKDVSLCV